MKLIEDYDKKPWLEWSKAIELKTSLKKSE